MNWKQHTSPCSLCPFRRVALKGWLGGLTPDEFKHLAESENRMPCHKAAQELGGVEYDNELLSSMQPQCAGRAIYWANQLKRPRDRSLLVLPRNIEIVFQWPFEFLEHHNKGSYKKGD